MGRRVHVLEEDELDVVPSFVSSVCCVIDKGMSIRRKHSMVSSSCSVCEPHAEEERPGPDRETCANDPGICHIGQPLGFH